MDLPPDARRRELLGALLCTGLAGCGGGGDGNGPPRAATRGWRMGFSPNPPRPDATTVLRGIDLWSSRAELVAIHEELPWTDLLGGMTPAAILERDKVQLVDYLRGKGLRLYVMIDPTDGLDRTRESPQLRAAGRSFTEPAIQQLYRDYVLAVASRLRPEYLGLAAETNLIRSAADPAVYAAVVQAANGANADLQAAGDGATRLVSVQVETAWGVLDGANGYAGVATDYADFPFLQLLGLSSYPYFGWTQPEDLPADYYSRLRGARTLPMMVVEGGWSSAAAGSISSSPVLQARYIRRHAELLDSVAARGWLQLLFADIDLAALPQPLPTNLPLFTSIGLTDSDFNAKPALAEWDALHARTLQP